MIAIAISFAAIIRVATLFARTRLGKQMRALSDNPQLASVAGIDTDRSSSTPGCSRVASPASRAC